MIYLVSGFPKCGTSGGMHSLEAGGLRTITSTGADKRTSAANDTEDFTANEYYHEPSDAQAANWDFPRSWDGYALKWLKNFSPERSGGIQVLAPHDYSVVVMTRHPEEIRQSADAMMAKRGLSLAALAPWTNYGRNQQGEYDRRIDLMLEHIENRADMKLNRIVRYREDLLADPLAVFVSLDWPIDAKAAAAVVDPDKCRHKIEALVPGITQNGIVQSW